ncbi:acetyltransferase [Colletotrichum orchidophilum]|uniref:Acetyltransferase n=1 Tax=Colletotrichum orchidophilum TaxID=1209926 RepID=A0A1G4AVV5_9PEZI|nr:acetyltransferase [Colletotrichum orchidophilum]OHE93255.1 acetyltransferase [Colletotrichum orchidophilum]
MAPWKIEPVTLADAPVLARNNMSAFWTNHNWTLVWPKDTTLDFLITQTTKRLPNNLIRDRATLRHQKAVDPQTGELVGYARWELPSGYEEATAWADFQIADVSEEERTAIKAQADAAWWKPIDMSGIDDCVPQKKRIMAEKPYISLDYLAVHPDHKGKGIATVLVQEGMRLAEQTGIDLFILAFEAALNVYKRLGFQEVHRGYQDDTKYGGKGYWVTLLTYEVKKTNDP